MRAGEHDCPAKNSEEPITEFCEHCEINYDPTTKHYCYIQPTEPKEEANRKIRYVFYDIETSQESSFMLNGVKVSEKNLKISFLFQVC